MDRKHGRLIIVFDRDCACARFVQPFLCATHAARINTDRCFIVMEIATRGNIVGKQLDNEHLRSDLVSKRIRP